MVIVGGGISGLATAYFLGKLGIRSTLFEKSKRLGGLIQTECVEGCRLEAGPDSYLAAKPVATELAEELGLREQIIGSNDRQRRIFIVRHGRLVALPEGMVMVAPSRWMPVMRSELFSAKTKFRFLGEIFSAPRTRAEDVSVAELVRNHFGTEMLESVAEPLLSGVYGGDSERLSAESVLPRFMAYERRYGSLIKGVRKERRSTQAGSLFLSFRDGMQSLTDALVKAIASWTEIVHEEVMGVEKTTQGWVVRSSGRRVECEDAVLACPAHVCAKLVEVSAPELAVELGRIPYSSAILVTLLYEAKQIEHAVDGFGFLVPRAQRRTISAATWVNRKFPSRIRAGLTAIRTFIVDPQASQLLNAPQHSIVESVREDLARVMGIRARPLFAGARFWPQSMPQYVTGHERRRRTIAGLLSRLPGLHVVGNAYEGVGIPDCVRMAKQTANRIRDVYPQLNRVS